jgi:hypothetical protein
MNRFQRQSPIPKPDAPLVRPVKFALSFVMLILACATFQDCDVIDDSNINAVCPADCTTLRGRFTTKDGNTGIANMHLEFDWRNGGIMGSRTRKIATTVTDDNGNYSITFYEDQNELKTGHYILTYQAPEETYLSGPYYDHFIVRDRDWGPTITANYHIPKLEGKIHLKLNNPEAVNGTDELAAELSYKFGDQRRIETYYSWGIFYGGRNQTNVSDSTINTAADQYTYIRVTKKKNGEEFSTMDSLKIRSGEEVTYLVDF